MNLIVLARLVANVAAVAVIGAFLVALALDRITDGIWWAWLIGGVTFGFGLLQFIVSATRPKDLSAAYDEQVLASERASRAFGYWVTLAVFVVFLVLVLNGVMSARLAFFSLGAPLAIAPPLFMLLAFVRGRAG